MPQDWLDGSKIDLLNLCPRKFFYRHERHLVPRVDHFIADAANFGIAIHKGLETLHLSRSAFERVSCPCPTMEGCDICRGERIPEFIAHFLLHYPTDPVNPKDARTRRRGVEILIAYLERYRNEGCTTLAVEIPFSIPFTHGEGEVAFEYLGRIDRIVKSHANDKVLPSDFKTTSRFGDLFDSQFKLSVAQTGYMVAVESILGVPVDSSLIDAIRVTTRISPEESFMRFETYRTPEEKDEWHQEVWDAWERVKRYRESGFWPKAAPFACNAYMRRCEYWGLCTSGEAVRRTLIETAFMEQPWNPVH